MTRNQTVLYERLKRLGFTQENQMKLYGEEFELLSDPIIVGDDLVFVDTVEKKTRRSRRVRIPLTIVRMASGEKSVA